MRCAGGALLALALTACSSSEPLAGAGQRIFGGAADADDAAVVAVVNFAGGQCSGSLIAPNLVLTARHCVADSGELAVVCGQTTFMPPDSAGAIFVVPRPFISEDPKDYVAVSELRVPAELGDDLCGTDVVLLRLKGPLSDVTPLAPRLDSAVMPGETYAAVGFGVDESLPGEPSGERKRLDDLRVRCVGGRCLGGDVRDNEWVGARGACKGDSGGPALDAEGRIIGVVSRGASGCEQAIYGDVFTRAAWLKAEATTAAAALRETAPSWARCDEESPCAPTAEAAGAAPADSCRFGPARAPGSFDGLCLISVAYLAQRRRHKLMSERHSTRL